MSDSEKLNPIALSSITDYRSYASVSFDDCSELEEYEKDNFGLQDRKSFTKLASETETEWKPSFHKYNRNDKSLTGKMANMRLLENGVHGACSYLKKILRPEPLVIRHAPSPREITVMRKVLAMVLIYQKKRRADPDGYTEVCIPQTRKQYIRLYGNQQNVGNVIRFMKRYGIIQNGDEQYCFNSEKLNRFNLRTYGIKTNFIDCAKTYCWDYNNEQIFLAYCRLYGITPWTENDNPVHVIDRELVSKINPDKVRIGKVNLKKPDHCTNGEFEKAVKEVLRQNYPQLAMIEKNNRIINAANSTLRNDIVNNISEPSLHWNEKRTKIVRIGYRNTNLFSSLPKACYGTDTLTRPAFLKSIGYDRTQFDVTSSVPKNMYLLHTGKWLEQSDDIYERIYGWIKENASESIHLRRFESDREVLKKLTLVSFFGSSPKNNVNHFIHSLSGKGRHLAETNRTRLIRAYESVDEAVKSVIGDTKDIGSEIFLHESAIYSMVQAELLKKGIRSVICYDCFYCDTENVDVESVVRKCALRYYSLYILDKDIHTVSTDTIADIAYSYVNNKKVSDKNMTIVQRILSHSRMTERMEKESSELEEKYLHYKKERWKSG